MPSLIADEWQRTSTLRIGCLVIIVNLAVCIALSADLSDHCFHLLVLTLRRHLLQLGNLGGFVKVAAHLAAIYGHRAYYLEVLRCLNRRQHEHHGGLRLLAP